MFRNFFIIAFRVLFRHRVYSLINIAGLAREFPEVMGPTHIFTFVEESTVKYKESSFLEERFFYADSGFSGVFPTGLVRGDPP